jgi:adenosine deaminase
MDDNFLQTFAATGMTADHAYQLARNSFEAGLQGSGKQRWIGRLDETFATVAWPASEVRYAVGPTADAPANRQ